MMSLDYLDRYIWEAEAHANELLQLLPLDEREDLLSNVMAAGSEETLLRLCRTAPPETFVFLGEAPSARSRKLAKMTVQQRNVAFLRARYHALQAARALRLAATVANVRGLSYRKAARHAAEAAFQAPGPPTLAEIMLLELPDR